MTLPYAKMATNQGRRQVMKMTFAEKLNEYMKVFFCTPKQLVALSGVSAATISRYRAGSREPTADSELFDGIVKGLTLAAQQAELTDIGADRIRAELLAVLRDDSGSYDIDSLRLSLDTLITKLHLNSRELAASLGMDQSKFFRIRTGQSRPPEIRSFCSGVGQHIFAKLGDDSSMDVLSDILGCTTAELMDQKTVCDKITGLLTGDAFSPRSYAESFLRELDRFDTDDDPAALDESSCLAASGEAEEAFVRAAKNARPGSSAIICTDLYSGSTEDDSMLKSLELIFAVLVREGIHIDFVLNADNPMDEILPGLKALMPLFLSGNISAYYLKGRRDGIYRNRLISLENAAFCIEAVTGHYDTAVKRVITREEEVESYRLRARQILDFASPLIEIIGDSESRLSVLASCSKKQGKRVAVLSTPPFFAMNNALLSRILRRNGVGDDEIARVSEYLHNERTRTLQILRHSEFVINYPDIPRESYDEKPVFLSVSGLFYDREILCTYDEYAEHIRLMKRFEKEHPRFCCIADTNSPFRNIQIFMHTGAWIMISKNKTPTVHLYIDHSKLRQALENMLSPYGESE